MNLCRVIAASWHLCARTTSINLTQNLKLGTAKIESWGLRSAAWVVYVHVIAMKHNQLHAYTLKGQKVQNVLGSDVQLRLRSWFRVGRPQSVIKCCCTSTDTLKDGGGINRWRKKNKRNEVHVSYRLAHFYCKKNTSWDVIVATEVGARRLLCTCWAQVRPHRVSLSHNRKPSTRWKRTTCPCRAEASWWMSFGTQTTSLTLS